MWPIEAVILAVGALTYAGYELYTHWDEVGEQWHDVWHSMVADVNDLIDSINRIPFVKIPHIGTRGGASGSWGALGGGFGTKGASGSWGALGGGKNSLLDTIAGLENSGDNAVSRAGAIGKYQIMPNTARQYGLDPSKLYNPAYNEMAATTILNDLQKKYGGDTDAILAAYNGGPGRANQFLASGRNVAALPSETQNYLAHAHALEGQAAGGGAVGGTSGAVTVLVDFRNAPRGMKTDVQTKGNVIANTKIGFAVEGQM
jgi:hypothetical protein